MRGRAGAAATGSLPWCRRSKHLTGNQSITNNIETAVTYNTIDNDDATVFASSGDGIEVLVDGLYSIAARVFWLAQPATCELYLNGIDPDAFAGYNGASLFTNHSILAAISSEARLAANQVVYLTVFQSSGLTKTIWGTGGTYLELRRLGGSTVNGRDA